MDDHIKMDVGKKEIRIEEEIIESNVALNNNLVVEEEKKKKKKHIDVPLLPTPRKRIEMRWDGTK